jgi:RNA polymerase sigma factor (TIGR02999 family)
MILLLFMMKIAGFCEGLVFHGVDHFVRNHQSFSVMDSKSEVSRIINAMREGDAEAAAKLLPLVYDELHRLAAAQMGREKPGHTLQTTALVHEAYLRLFGDGEPCWENRRHFFTAAAAAMRRILIDDARKKGCRKRGGDQVRVDLKEVGAGPPDLLDDLLDLDDALVAMAAEAPEKAKLVELRYFAGLTIEEAAEFLGISKATGDRYWTYARAWLYVRLRGRRPKEPPAGHPGEIS